MLLASVCHLVLVVYEGGTPEYWTEHPSQRFRVHVPNLILTLLFTFHAVTYMCVNSLIALAPCYSARL